LSCCLPCSLSALAEALSNGFQQLPSAAAMLVRRGNICCRCCCSRRSWQYALGLRLASDGADAHWLQHHLAGEAAVTVGTLVVQGLQKHS